MWLISLDQNDEQRASCCPLCFIVHNDIAFY